MAAAAHMRISRRGSSDLELRVDDVESGQL
jgi:hypothetical protein